METTKRILGPRTRKLRWMVALGAGAVVVLCVLWYPAQPSYEGKSLETWVLELNQADSPSKAGHEIAQRAARAIRKIGKPAIPFLTKWLNRKQTEYASMLRVRISRLPRLLYRFFARHLRLQPDALRAGAILALGALGPAADEAAQPLIQLLRDPNQTVRLHAVWALARVGLHSKQEALVVRALCAKASEMRTDLYVVDTIFGVLGDFQAEAGMIIPVLQEGLSLPDMEANWGCLNALAELHRPDAVEMAVLKKFLDPAKQTVWVRLAAINLLKEQRSAPTNALPLLRLCLDDPNARVRAEARKAIQTLDPDQTL